ncbi:tetratricopeptide repeat protein [Deinococcus roseus]|uniref:Tetratrico peptide repeat group 5 domain-containing protein n=1 Tax=Deinococcus roseus TaxID=392414 RepID=A0ABQ2CWC9_9DEIO|nr:tetratricopeptide repeat protein [Deinococcus roseus]GGJ27387.1 hypothetical protein GCM10008938_11840 [Deinococcus roseus]
MPNPLHPDVLMATRHSAVLLWESGQIALTVQTLQTLLDAARKQHDFAVLHESVFSALPEDLLCNTAVAEQYAFVLCRARKQPAYLNFLERFSHHHHPTPALKVVQGWALMYNQQQSNIETALVLLQAQEGQTQGWFEGLRLRILGECLAWLNRAGWEAHFVQARQHLTGASLGLCLMEEGTYQANHGRPLEARTLWAEALPLLREDAHYHAWLRYNLGITILGTYPEEAERHFLELEQLRHRQEAKDFLASAWRGLGSARRVLGELDRAVACYREALKRATEKDDREQALWGLGRTFTQAGKAFEGLSFLKEAHQVQEARWIQADMAVAHLLLEDLTRAEKAAHSIDLHNAKRSGQVALLCLAEISRQQNQMDQVQKHLSSIDFSRWHLREDRRCFEHLFVLAEQLGFPAIKVFPLVQGYTVQVQAEGVLNVQVNGRPIPLKPTSKPAELLVRLLEKDGRDTLDSLLDALFRDEDTTRRKAGQALWNHVKKLRALLGWEDSVQAPGGVFLLDPGACWNYDMAEARTSGRKVRGFLEGVYSEWVLETQQELGTT